jgi:hypothetical protein
MSQELDFEKLRLLAYKVRCLGYFLETQDPNHVCPVDFDEVQYGFSIFVNEIAADMVAISEAVGKSLEK